MDDLIYRQAALDALGKKPLAWVEGEQRWIPCSKTKEVPEYEVIACDADGAEMIGFLASDGERWECESDHELMYDVVAWMPLADRYHPEGDKE